MKRGGFAHILLSAADEIEGQTGSVLNVNLRDGACRLEVLYVYRCHQKWRLAIITISC